MKKKYVFLIFKVYFVDYAITVDPFFSTLYSPLSCTLAPTCNSPGNPPPRPTAQFLSMGHTYKLFGFSFSYIILNFHLYIMPTNYASYSLYIFPLLSPTPTPRITLRVISISVILLLFWLSAQFVFVFVFRFSC